MSYGNRTLPDSRESGDEAICTHYLTRQHRTFMLYLCGFDLIYCTNEQKQVDTH